jgi:site-specific recombinase XerD
MHTPQEKNFTEWLLKYCRYTKETLAQKIQHMRQWKAFCSKRQPLHKMDAVQLLKIIEVHKQYYAAQTLNQHIRTLEQYYYYLLERGIITRHPLKNFRVKTPKPKLLQGFIESTMLDTIYINYPVSGHQGGQFDLYSYRNKVMLGLLMYQALTKHCLENINLNHIDLQKAQIHILKTTSRLNQRTLSIEAIQMLELRHYIEVIRPQIISLHSEQHQRKGVDADLLFPRSQTTKVSIVLAAIRKKIQTYYPLNDMKQLRNSCIALWLEHNNIRKVQYMAGFKSLASVEKYNQKNLKDLQEALELYKPF